MSEEIVVQVVKYPDRKNYMMRYQCPLTGKQIARSTGTHIKRAAEKAAAKWEAELREGRYVKSPRMNWDDFILHYSDHGLGGVADSTAYGYLLALTKFAEMFRPKRVGDLTT